MLVRYNPFRALQRRDYDLPSLWDTDFFSDLWEGFLPSFPAFPSLFKMDEPRIEVKENKKNYLIRGEFPGFGKDEVKAEIVDGVLRLHAEHKEEKWDQDEDEGWRSIETRRGSYTRSIPLPDDVVTDKVKAEMKNGVLRITLPKDPKKARPVKEIEIH